MIDLKPSINFWHDFKSNQRAGMWLFLGSRKSLQIVRPSIPQLIFWGILGGVANSLFSWLIAGDLGEFNKQGLVSYALWPFIALIVGIFLSQRINNPRMMLVPALLWLVLDTHIAILQSFIQYLGYIDVLPYIFYDYLPTIFMVLFVWQSLAVVWVFSRELKWPWWERALIVAATLFTLVVWQMSVKSQPIWKVEETPPTFAEDAGEEPELTGLYVVGDDGKPYRVGFALGNEFSDHVMERRNYLYLAHSKLRNCSYGPELRVGDLPGHLSGMSRILRGDEVLWEKAFLSGEDNMCHSLENLEYHHFKYAQFLRPGDVHVHFFGTATLSVADNIQTRPGDRFEISMAEFGEPLINGLQAAAPELKAGKVNTL